MYLSLFAVVRLLEILMILGTCSVPVLHFSTLASLGATLGYLAISLPSESYSKGTKPLGIVFLFSWMISFPASWVRYSGTGPALSSFSNMFYWSIFTFSNSPDISMDLLICSSSSKICQWSILSRIEGLCLTSILYFLFGYMGILKTLVETAKASTMPFSFLRMTDKWYSLKLSNKSSTEFLYDLNLGCLA